ncbi:MAG: DNA polymerase III subunit beta [Bacteroidetes bacterium]|nr:DNA polymerase III subunit beta [Bacteroidota bacterium]MCY4234454.1 DNA polymerase III subunit beta [Bacteroidota bacterium]
MKFTTVNTDLYRALDGVCGALPKKPEKEILKCVLLERKNDLLELRATDMEISIRHKIPVNFLSEEGDEPNVIAVPAQEFLDTCRSLPDIPITCEIDDKCKIVLSHASGQYDWMGYKGESFPEFPSITDAQEIQFDRQLLKTGFDLVGFATGQDASRPGMMGILFEILEGSARVVSTDGHRLTRCIFKSYDGDLDVKALAPHKAFQQFARIDGLDKCSIQITENHLCLDLGYAQVISRLINAKFPKYERAIPEENDKIVLVDRRELLGSIQRVNIFASENSNHIVLDCKDDTIVINAVDVERSSKGSETVNCSYSGEPTQIGFNAQYLLELLRYLPSDEITLSMGIPNRAALLKPVPQDDDIHLTFLIMPIMLNKLE